MSLLTPDLRIPVTILTGFLGAGKTTLVNRLLTDPAFADTAVVVNEFGEIAVDHALIATADENLRASSTGCLCCTVQGDVRDTIRGLLDRREAGEIPEFERILIETTGVADPAPAMHTLMADPDLLERTALNGVATVVDAVHGDAALDRFEEARRQVGIADLLLLSKTDLIQDPASARDLERLRDRLRALNPTAAQVDLAVEGLEPDDLAALAAEDPAAGPPDPEAWLARAEAAPWRAAARDHDHPGHGHTHGHGHGHGHGHRHDHHDHNHDGFAARALWLDDPLDPTAFWAALEQLVADLGPHLLRIKGLIALADAPDQPVVLHGVQHVFHPPARLPDWPSDDRRTRLVIIAHEADPASLADAVARLAGAAGPDA